MIRQGFIALFTAMFVAAAFYSAWHPGHRTDTSFDKGCNGIWVGHRWFSGREVGTGHPLGAIQIDSLAQVLRVNGMKYVFVHAGPILSDGTIREMPDAFFYKVKNGCPRGTVFLPWLGGHAQKLPLQDRRWRATFLSTLGELHARGFDGVHIDIEPLRDMHPGYLGLLRDIRQRFPEGFIISHATRRLSPLGVSPWPLSGSFWSAAFYRETMHLTDQTVLMGYDTALRFRKPFVAFISYQTFSLVRMASLVPRHRVQIGIPSYEDVPWLSDPRVENIRNAVAGVRAGLERSGDSLSAFEGVSVYAHWVTDTSEWKDLSAYWLRRR